MLRPATPLAILLFAAFALLLLAVLSTPIIKGIPLGEFNGFKFGVFGYCEDTRCSPIEIGYDAGYAKSSSGNDFDIDTKTRTTLSAILIVHPAAAFLVLVMFGMAVAAHFHAASHSSRYLLVVFIFGIITFLVCLLCFLVDVLLFVPHMAWGSYLVLAATILVFLSFIVSCAMRRTVVSRKARKKRIAENAEMSGENYYNREALAATAVATRPTQPTVPAMTSAAAEKLPAFASYESRNDQSSDERIPLTQTSPGRSASNPSTEQVGAHGMYNKPSHIDSTRTLPRDQFGNPINPPQDAYGGRQGTPHDQMRGRGGAMGGARGRGGYDRGGYGGRPGLPQGGRGGYGPSGRGGLGGPGPLGPPGRGGGYGPRGGYANGPRGGYAGAGPNDRQGPSPANAFGNYDQGQGPTQQGIAYGSSQPAMGMQPAEQDLPRAESPPPLPPPRAESPPALPPPRAESPPALPPQVSDPFQAGNVGMAVEMNAQTGSPAHPPRGFGQFNTQLRDSDADVAGMLALQQGRLAPPVLPGNRHDTFLTEASRYSQDEGQYPPARQDWNEAHNGASTGIPPPLVIPPRNPEPTAQPQPQAAPPAPGQYYEDVDPRFVQPSTGPRNAPVENTSTDDLHNAPGSRSPAISERSGFTSISQRPVNPQWRPGPGLGQGQGPPPKPGPGHGQSYGPRLGPGPGPGRGPGHGASRGPGHGAGRGPSPKPPRKPVNKGPDLLASNPDFELPGLGRKGNARGPAGGMAGGAYPAM